MNRKTALNRSQQMARIKNKNTSPELVFRKALWQRGLRYRLHVKTPFGRPDLVFPGKNVALFVDGCFWHGCPIHYVRPRSRGDFWAAKLVENVARDCFQTRSLETNGWRVFRVWEHEVFTQLPEVITQVQQLLEVSDKTLPTSWRVFKVAPLDETGHFEKRYMLDLRDSQKLQCIEGARLTTKWRVPKP